MFCTKCGTKNDDGARFCAGCGNLLEQATVETPVTPQEPVNQGWAAGPTPTPVTPQEPVYQGWTPEPAPQKKKLPIVPIAIGGIAAVVVIVLLVVLLGGGGGYKKAVNDFLAASTKPDYEKAAKMTVPKACWDEMIEEIEEELEDEGYDDIEEFFDEMNDNVDYMKEYKIKYSIKGAEKLDDMDKYEDESSYEDLDDLAESLASELEDYGFDEDEVQDAYIVEVELSATFEGETEKQEVYVVAYKYDGAWYVAEDIDLF